MRGAFHFRPRASVAYAAIAVAETIAVAARMRAIVCRTGVSYRGTLRWDESA